MDNKLPFKIALASDKYLHLIEQFSCGHDEIDRYIKEDALLDQYNGRGVTYLILNELEDKLIAYYTLMSTSLIYAIDNSCNTKIDKLRISGFPAIEIKMFAVSKTYQKCVYLSDDLGNTLYSDLILGSLIGDIYTFSSEVIGIQMIILYSTDEALKLYRRNHFEDLGQYIPLYSEYTKDCTPMYLRLF